MAQWLGCRTRNHKVITTMSSFWKVDVCICHTKQRISHCPSVAKDFAPSQGHIYGSFKGIVTYLQPSHFDLKIKQIG